MLTAVATTIAIMSGRITEYSPVSSNTMITAVIGARAAPANTAPMPTSAYAPAGAVRLGSAVCASCPNAEPSIAPMNRDGAKTPPEPPMAIVRLVATTFAASSSTTNPTTYLPSTACDSTG